MTSQQATREFHVWNLKMGQYPPGCTLITRPHLWGNPYLIGRDTRDQVCDLFEQLMRTRLLDPVWQERLERLSRSAGLLCCCSPLRCHGDVLVKIMKELGLLT